MRVVYHATYHDYLIVLQNSFTRSSPMQRSQQTQTCTLPVALPSLTSRGCQAGSEHGAGHPLGGTPPPPATDLLHDLWHVTGPCRGIWISQPNALDGFAYMLFPLPR